MNRQFLLCVGRTGTCMGTMAFAGALPVLTSVWHMDATTAGAIQTAFNLSNALALLISSWLSDGMVRISANVTADFGNVTDSAGFGIARC